VNRSHKYILNYKGTGDKQEEDKKTASGTFSLMPEQEHVT